jgi:hypothetical protein
MLSGTMKMKNIIIQGEGNVDDVTVGHSADEDSMVMKMGSEVLMCGVQFPTDVGFGGNVVLTGNVESSGGASIQLGETVLTEMELKRLLALLI